MKIFFKIIIAILIFALLGGGFYLAYKYTRGFSGSVTEFNVEYENKILTDVNTIKLKTGKEHTFKIKSLNGLFAPKAQNFSVKIVPKVTDGKDFSIKIFDENVFEYTEMVMFSQFEDLNKGFNLTIVDNYFTIAIPYENSIETIVKNMYTEKKVEIDTNSIDLNFNYFEILIISDNAKDVLCSIEFGLEYQAKEIKMDIEKWIV